MYLIKPLGDNGLIIQFSNKINPTINRRILHFMDVLTSKNIDGLIEIVPSYTTCTVYYDPIVWDYEDFKATLKEILPTLDIPMNLKFETIFIPTLYDESVGPELNRVASVNQLSIQEVIQLHTTPVYHIYMLGFLPGFPYLGGLNPKLKTPRLSSPRQKVVAGSVGIANMQTGIYSVDSPGGWNIIGRTPLKLFDINKEKPFLLSAGSKVKFVSISKEQFEEISDLIKHGEYEVKREVNT